MPPQQRARKTAATPPEPSEDTPPAPPQDPAVDADPTAAAEPTTDPAPICPECFLGGWNGLPPDAATAGCEHGTYSR